MSEHQIALSRRAFVGCAATMGAAAALSFTFPMQAFGETAAEKQAEAAAMLDKLNAMQSKLNAASDDYYSAVSRQEEAQAKMDEAQARIDEATAQITDLQDHLSTRARSMYRTGSSSFIDLLLGATSFQAFTTNWDVLNSMNEKDGEMVEQTKGLRAEVEEQKAVFAQEEAIAADEAAKAAEIKNEAEALVKQYRATYDSLSAEAAQLLEEEKAAREAENQRKAQAELAQLQSQPAKSSGSKYNNAKVQTVTGSVVANRALSMQGKPYVWGSTGPNSFDCSGLVSYALSGTYKRLGTSGYFGSLTRVSDPQPGDICCGSGHVGIYIGGGQMVHAPEEGDVVRVSSVQPGMWYTRY